MALAENLGGDVSLTETFRPDALLFGEAQSRIIVAIKPENSEDVIAKLNVSSLPYAQIGTITGRTLRISYPGGSLEHSLDTLREAYETPLRKALA